MKRLSRFSKRTWVLVGVIAVVAAMASVGAYAYWTTGGSGSGTASTGDTTDNLVIVGSGSGTTTGTNPVTIANGLTPGGTAAVSFKVYNPNSYSVHVTDVSQFGVIANSNSGPSPLCDTAWFSFATVNLNETIPAATLGTVHSGSVAMSDPNVDQNGCKSVTYTLSLSSN